MRHAEGSIAALRDLRLEESLFSRQLEFSRVHLYRQGRTGLQGHERTVEQDKLCGRVSRLALAALRAKGGAPGVTRLPRSESKAWPTACSDLPSDSSARVTGPRPPGRCVVHGHPAGKNSGRLRVRGSE